MPTGAAPSAFEQTLQKFLNYALPIGQLLFWIALIVVLFLAWWQLRKLANHFAPEKKAAAALSEEHLDLEEFVD